MEEFRLLNPDVVLSSAEASFGVDLNGVITPYTSYVNRVYGLEAADGREFVAKYYRPNRWTEEAILEEHQFCWDCADAELPVVPPIPDEEGATLQSVTVEGDGTQEFLFALYPRRGGRTFDTDRDEDWLRIGAMLGRLHGVGADRPAPSRLRCHPAEATRAFLQEIRVSGTVHPDVAEPFFTETSAALDAVAPLFAGVKEHRVHGDCHRANILERGEEGLLLIDFDDMMTGPAVQDIWLLLPDHAHNSTREIALLLEGYETFRPFDRETLALIEPLRLMRIIYFLAWSVRQSRDHQFLRQFPDWGTEAFWIKELEDVRTQIGVCL